MTPNVVWALTVVCNVYAEVPLRTLCTLLLPLALLFALCCAHLRSFALVCVFCVWPRLERPRWEFPDMMNFYHFSAQRTKNRTALESVVFCYRCSCSLFVPFSCLFCLEKQVFLSPLCSVFLRPYRIFAPYRNSLSVVFLVREGHFSGSAETQLSEPEKL